MARLPWVELSTRPVAGRHRALGVLTAVPGPNDRDVQIGSSLKGSMLKRSIVALFYRTTPPAYPETVHHTSQPGLTVLLACPDMRTRLDGLTDRPPRSFTGPLTGSLGGKKCAAGVDDRCPAKVGQPKVHAAQVGAAQASLSELSPAEIGSNMLVFCTPPVPD